jgi:hypothetical protein
MRLRCNKPVTLLCSTAKTRQCWHSDMAKTTTAQHYDTPTDFLLHNPNTLPHNHMVKHFQLHKTQLSQQGAQGFSALSLAPPKSPCSMLGRDEYMLMLTPRHDCTTHAMHHNFQAAFVMLSLYKC